MELRIGYETYRLPEIKPYVSCQDGHWFYPQLKRPAGDAKRLLAITIFFKEIFSTFDEFIFHKYASISLQNFDKNSTWYFSIAIALLFWQSLAMRA